MLGLPLVWRRYLNWWSRLRESDRVIWISITLATMAAASLRLVNLRSGLQYLADQGRDVIVAYGILHGDIALVGPSTSVGDMFLGPLYYYFMAPFLWLAGNDPVGPAAAVAVLGIFTVPLLYWVGSKLVGRGPALIATLLYTTAPVVIEFTRFSWNPNPAPFVSLLLLYCTWRAWKGSAWWWLGAAASLAVILQLHYVAALAAAPAAIYWLADLVRSFRRGSSRSRVFIWSSLSSLMLVLASFLPLAIFNWRFNNIIVKGFIDFLNGGSEAKPTLSQTLARSLRETQGRALQALFELWGKEWTVWYRQINSSLLGGYLIILLAGWRAFWHSRYRHGYQLILIAFAGTVLGLSWYRSSVFFHYLSFFFPVSYLLTGLVIFFLVRWLRWLGIALGLVLMAYIFWLSAQPAQLLYLNQAGWQVGDVQRVAQQIIATVPPEKSYGLTELSEVRDYRGMVYRYFLLASSHPPVPFESAPNADYLIVIAGNPREPSEVLSSPVYEIASFPKGEYRVIKNERGPWIYLISRKAVVQ